MGKMGDNTSGGVGEVKIRVNRGRRKGVSRKCGDDEIKCACKTTNIDLHVLAQKNSTTIKFCVLHVRVIFNTEKEKKQIFF